MRMYTTFLTAFALCSAATVNASHANSLDKDGCWDGRTAYGSTCITSSSQWSNSRYSKDKLIVSITNRCNYRVYAKFCNQRSTGGPDCGSSGIRAGATKTWATSNATGRHRSRAIGSDIPSKDWVCSGKARGWHNSMF